MQLPTASNQFNYYPQKRDGRVSLAVALFFYSLILASIAAATLAAFADPSILKFLLWIVTMTVCGAAIPAGLEDIGCHLVEWRLYSLAKVILLTARSLYGLTPQSGCASMASLALGRLCLYQSNYVQAEKWALECLKLSRSESYRCKLYAHSLLGQLRFVEGDEEQALEHLWATVELHKEKMEVYFPALQNTVDEYQADNFDRLGQILLNRGDAKAKTCFYHSLALRKVVPKLNRTAESYAHLVLGRLAAADKPAESAAFFRAALKSCPQPKSTGELELSIEIATKVIQTSEEGCEEWAKAHDLIGRAQMAGLHPHYLEVAALAPMLGQATSNSRDANTLGTS